MKQKLKTRRHLRSKQKGSTRKYLLQGGVKWRAGADTCVFKPLLGCHDDPRTRQEREKFLMDKYGPNGLISRVVSVDAPDLLNETFIHEHFGGLVDRGIVNVFVQACNPVMHKENLEYAKNVAGQKLGACHSYNGSYDNELASVNLITKYYPEGSVYQILQNNSYNLGEVLQSLKGALNAAVGLVPDKGPWVIHTDCHLGNIFFDEKKSVTTLGDWGRCMLIRDPYKDDKEWYYKIRSVPDIWVEDTTFAHQWSTYERLQSGIPGGLGQFKWIMGLKPLQSFQDISLLRDENNRPINFDKYPQHPSIIIEKLQQYEKILNNLNQSGGWEKIEHMDLNKWEDVNTLAHMTDNNWSVLRGWTSFAILNCLTPYIKKDNQVYYTSVIRGILQCQSQLGLQNYLNSIIGESIGDKNYVDTAKFTDLTLNPDEKKQAMGALDVDDLLYQTISIPKHTTPPTLITKTKQTEIRGPPPMLFTEGAKLTTQKADISEQYKKRRSGIGLRNYSGMPKPPPVYDPVYSNHPQRTGPGGRPLMPRPTTRFINDYEAEARRKFFGIVNREAELKKQHDLRREAELMKERREIIKQKEIREQQLQALHPNNSNI